MITLSYSRRVILKAPDIKDLSKLNQQDTFSKKVVEVKAQAQQIAKKTFSLNHSHLDYVNGIALELGQQRGKVVGASEALRLIIEQHEEQSK